MDPVARVGKVEEQCLAIFMMTYNPVGMSYSSSRASKGGMDEVGLAGDFATYQSLDLDGLEWRIF
jgi:hypothetical protein